MLIWLYMTACFYTAIGIILFPSWWKRAFVRGDIFDPKFLRLACIFLWDLMMNGHPLGLFLPAVAIFFLICVIFFAGKVGLKRSVIQLPRPSKKLCTFATVLLLVMVFSFRFIGGNYLTPEELQAELVKLRNQIDLPFNELANRPIDWQAPQAGYFLYLDAPRIRIAYSAVQKEFEIAAHTTKTERERAGGASLAAGVVKIDATGKMVEENSITKMPVTATPERQAKYLIEKFDTGPTVNLSEPAQRAASGLDAARKILTDAGIQLTFEQQSQCIAYVSQKLAESIERRGNILRHSEKMSIQRSGTNYALAFTGGGLAHVEFTAALEERYIDTLLVDLLKKTNSAEMFVRLLSVEALRTGSGTNYMVKLLPLAMW